MDIQNQSFLSIEQLTDRYSLNQTGKSGQMNDSGASFQDILLQKAGQGTSVGSLKFSKHAAGRLSTRNISLSDSQMERLQSGADKAGQKGIKDALVMVDELVFIVNVPNSTVITAMDSTETDENVFTNINGAVIM